MNSYDIYNKEISESYQRCFEIDNFEKLSLDFHKKEIIQERKEKYDALTNKLVYKYGKEIIQDIDNILSALNIDAINSISAGSIASQRGRRLEDFIEFNIKNILKEKNAQWDKQVKTNNPLYPSFLKESVIDPEIPDFVIRSENFNAVINVQVSLWGGGAQTNRGHKYNNDSFFDKNGWNLYTIVCDEPPLIKKKKDGSFKLSKGRLPRAVQIAKSGYESGNMLYPYDFFKKLESLQ